MTDEEIAIQNIREFVEDENKRVLLLKGYDDDAKFRVAFGVLRKYFDSGIINCSSLGNIDELINRAYGNRQIVPRVNTNKNYIIFKTKVGFNSYYRSNSRELLGSDRSFSIFFPIQSALVTKNNFEKLVNKIERTETKKIILIPTNEHSYDLTYLESIADTSYFYNVENDNPELIKIMKGNGIL